MGSECYKVVLEYNEEGETKLGSVSVRPQDPHHIEYKIGYRSVALTGKLFVFEDLWCAMQFAESFRFPHSLHIPYRVHILRCECADLTPVEQCAKHADYGSVTLWWLWRGVLKRCGREAPAGSFVTRWVLPWQEVT
jgi:hypothetical protein